MQTIRKWFLTGWPSTPALRVGYFVITLLTLELIIVIGLIAAGVNPTLVVSVIGAPIWICTILLSRRFVQWLMKTGI